MIKGLLIMFTAFLAVSAGVGGYTSGASLEKIYYPMVIIFLIITALIGVYM